MRMAIYSRNVAKKYFSPSLFMAYMDIGWKYKCVRTLFSAQFYRFYGTDMGDDVLDFILCLWIYL